MNHNKVCNPDQHVIHEQIHDEFKSNEIVLYLLKHSKLRRDDLLSMDFPVEDKNQFAQLTGMHVGDYLDHPEISKNAKFRCKMMMGE